MASVLVYSAFCEFCVLVFLYFVNFGYFVYFEEHPRRWSNLCLVEERLVGSDLPQSPTIYPT